MAILITLIIFSILYILIALTILVFFLSTIQTILYVKVPFVPVPKEVLPNILKALELKDGSVMYDLGCGDARVLVEAAGVSAIGSIQTVPTAQEAQPSHKATAGEANFVGIERVWLPLVLAKLRVWRNKKRLQAEGLIEPEGSSEPERPERSRRIKIYNQDFFETDLSNATHVFLYLSSKIMDELLPKLERELKPGTRVVSVSFKFSNKAPKEIINLNRNDNQLARELYVYEF